MHGDALTNTSLLSQTTGTEAQSDSSYKLSREPIEDDVVSDIDVPVGVDEHSPASTTRMPTNTCLLHFRGACSETLNIFTNYVNIL